MGAGIAPFPAKMPAAVGAAQHRKVEGCGGKSQQDHRAAEEEVIGQGEQHGAHQHGDDQAIEQAAGGGKGHSLHGRISSQKSGSEGQQASSLWMVRAARRVPAATARPRESPRVSPEMTPEKKASPAPVESTISTRWAGQCPASPVMLS